MSEPLAPIVEEQPLEKVPKKKGRPLKAPLNTEYVPKPPGRPKRHQKKSNNIIRTTMKQIRSGLCKSVLNIGVHQTIKYYVICKMRGIRNDRHKSQKCV